jgi:hypothetical protein
MVCFRGLGLCIWLVYLAWNDLYNGRLTLLFPYDLHESLTISIRTPVIFWRPPVSSLAATSLYNNIWD